MTAANALSSRYITPDFRTSPLLALVYILGLEQYSRRVKESPEFYGSILTGVTLYRHLSAADKMQVNHAIVREMPPCGLQTRLMGLVSDLSVQKLWYMWALSDDEVLEFFSYSSNVAGITEQFNPVETPSATVASIAGGAYLLSKKGSRAVLSKAASSVTTSPLVLAMGKKFGLGPDGLRVLGGFGVAVIVVISGINIMAKKNSEKAKQELAARGLLLYSEL